MKQLRRYESVLPQLRTAVSGGDDDSPCLGADNVLPPKILQQLPAEVSARRRRSMLLRPATSPIIDLSRKEGIVQ